MRVLLAIALSTTLLACGGGGGGGGSLPGALTASDDGSAPGTSNPSMPGNPGNPGAPSSPAATPDGPDFASIGPDPMAVLPARDTPLTVVAATRGSRSSGIPRTPGGEPGNIDRVTAYALSDNSWVAMAIDVVADGSGANILFRGMFGELQAIARSGDQLAGFPSNVTLGASNEILVLDDSTIYVNADLQGAVERNSEALVRVAPDGSLTGLLRQGQLLETSIRGETVDDFEFLSSSGENVFAGVETNQGNRYVVQLNGDVPQIIVRGVGSNNFMNTEGQPSIGNCFIQAIDIQNGQIFTNNTGAIAFAADLQIDSAEACPRVAIVQYEDGEFSYIWNPVGNLVAIGDSNFTNLDMLGFADDGTAYVEVIAFRDGADIVRSVWVADGVNSPRMVALEGETLPPNFDPGAVIESRGFFDSTNSRIDTRLAVANNRQFSIPMRASTILEQVNCPVLSLP